MKISDVIIDMHQGINTVADKVEYLDSGIPIIQSKNFTKGYLDLEDVRYLGEEDEKKYIEKYNPHVGDILMANIGTIGKSYVISEEQRFLIAWNAFLIKPNAEKVKSDFLKFYFDYLASTHYFDGLLTGGTVKFINKKRIGDINIPDKSLAEQSEICNVLSQVEKVIIQRQQEMELLDDLIKARFVELFGNPITNDRGWKVAELNTVCDGIGDGLHGTPEYDEDGEYPFINGNNLMDGVIKVTPATKMVNEDTYKKHFIELTDNAILLSINGTLGKLAFYNGQEVMLGKSACYCNLKPEINREFVYGVMKTDAFAGFLESNATASTIKNVGLKAIRGFKLILPPEELQFQFIEFAKQVDKSKFIDVDMNKIEW